MLSQATQQQKVKKAWEFAIMDLDRLIFNGESCFATYNTRLPHQTLEPWNSELWKMKSFGLFFQFLGNLFLEGLTSKQIHGEFERVSLSQNQSRFIQKSSFDYLDKWVSGRAEAECYIHTRWWCTALRFHESEYSWNCATYYYTICWASMEYCSSQQSALFCATT